MDKEYKTIDGELELKNMRSQMSMELMQDSTNEQFKKEKEAIGMSAIMASSSATTSSAPQGLMKAWEVEYSLNSCPSAPPELESIRASSQDQLHILSPIQSDNDSSAGPGLRQRLESMGHHELVSIAIDMAQQLEHLSQPPDTKFFMDSVEMVSSQFNSPNITGIEHLLKDGLLAFLLKFKKYMPQYPPQVVKFDKVNFSAQVLGAEQGYETVGSKCFKCLLPCFSKRQGIQKFMVLENCSGYLMPGTMTLVCGPPGCGKSSFHKALAGRLFIDDTTTLNGTVSYNGKDISDIQVRRIAAFIAQSDRHLPTLTVRETCAFANTCTSHYNKTEYNFADDPNLAREASWLKNENLPLEMTLHLLGLRGVMDTPIGNTTIRGVSGGERHRVTTAEMVSGTFLVYFLDEISTGLDSSAAYDIVSTFRTYARIKQFTCLFSLLQPSPEVFDLFDRIIVLNEGRIIFQGPRGDVLSYFKTLGYVKPNHVDVADFLQEVTTEEGTHFLLPEFRHLTSNEFVKAYMDSDMYKDVLRIVNNTQNVQELWLDVAKPLGLSIVNKPSKPGEKGIVVVDKVEASGMATAVNIQHTADVKEGDTIMAIGVVGEELEYLGLPTSTLDAFGIFGKVAEAPRNIILQLERPLEKEDEEAASVFKQEYVQEWWPSTKTVLQRQATLVRRNKSFVYARIVQLLILGLFTGTLFYQLPNTTLRSDMDLRKSLAFLAVMTLSLNTFSQIPVQLDERSVGTSHPTPFF